MEHQNIALVRTSLTIINILKFICIVILVYLFFESTSGFGNILLKDWLKAKTFSYIKWAFFLFCLLETIGFILNRYMGSDYFEDRIIQSLEANQEKMMKRIETRIALMQKDTRNIADSFSNEISEIKTFNQNAERITDIEGSLAIIYKSSRGIAEAISSIRNEFEWVNGSVQHLAFMDKVNRAVDAFDNQKFSQATKTLNGITKEASTLDNKVKYIAKDIQTALARIKEIKEELDRSPLLKLALKKAIEQEEED